MTLVAGLLLAGLAVALAARAVVIPRLRASERLGDIASYGFPVAAGPAATGPSEDPGRAGALTLFGEVMSRRLPGSTTEEVSRLLVRAGRYQTPATRIVGLRVLATIAFPALWLWVGSNAGLAGYVVVTGFVLTALSGWVLPIAALRSRGDRRMRQIDYALPELVDVLVVTVEAGLALSASLQLAGQRVRGPLGHELALTLQEQRFGLPLNEALQNMLSRCDTPSMRSFVRSVLQGETLGVSIGEIMRNLAADMRTRRRQDAEERAQKAPVKMLFPLIFLIFPPVLLVLLFPAGYSLVKLLGGN